MTTLITHPPHSHEQPDLAGTLGGWRIAIVQDDSNLEQALRSSFATSPNIASVELFRSREVIPKFGSWDDLELSLVNIGLPGMSGLELIGEMQRCFPLGLASEKIAASPLFKRESGASEW